ncbi:MAG: RES domain-containing protein [bacterium]|nr:RES domain-containing protein [bacterium]
MKPLDYPHSAKLLASMRRCQQHAAPWEGTVFRSTTLEYSRSGDITSGEGSRLYGGRWNPVGHFAAIYACLDPETAMEETLAHFRYYGIPEHAAMPRLFVAIEVRLSLVLDLRDGRLRQRLRVSSERMMASDWRTAHCSEGGSVTQSLGWAAYSVGLEGLLVPSAVRRAGTNLIAFPGNLRSSSKLGVLGRPGR